ncbi:hypothetical protein ACOMHN_064619 [Nucella lapillus]
MDERQPNSSHITDEPTVTSLTADDGRDGQVAALPLTGGDGVVIRAYNTSPHYLPLAVFTLFVNVVLGLPAVVCACLSRSRRQRGEVIAASKWGKAAFWLSLVGIAVSVVLGVFAFVYIYVIIPNIVHINLGGIT